MKKGNPRCARGAAGTGTGTGTGGVTGEGGTGMGAGVVDMGRGSLRALVNTPGTKRGGGTANVVGIVVVVVVFYFQEMNITLSAELGLDLAGIPLKGVN